MFLECFLLCVWGGANRKVVRCWFFFSRCSGWDLRVGGANLKNIKMRKTPRCLRSFYRFLVGFIDVDEFL